MAFFWFGSGVRAMLCSLTASFFGFLRINASLANRADFAYVNERRHPDYWNVYSALYVDGMVSQWNYACKGRI